MNYMIKKTSEYALSILQSHTCGTVHSVYRKTVNLLLRQEASGRSAAAQTAADAPTETPVTREALVALQAAGSPLSPISLITELSGEQMASLPIEAGMEVRIQFSAPLTISIGPRCTFRIHEEKPANLFLSPALSEDELDALRQRILDVLALRDAGSFELLFTAPERASGIPFLAAAQKRLADTETALAQASFAEAAAQLRRLIGLGLGLTPGGDDFLCGVLAGIRLCGLDAHPFSVALREEISRHLSDTNKISAAFLACALENQFSQAVNELRLCFSVPKILHIFREIGHSSGTDTLCGIFYILYLRRVF